MVAEIEVVFKLILAVILGVLVGTEREVSHKPAGMRTNALVCMGATLFAVVSLSFSAGEISRVAAGVVTGIGFLGAGTIFIAREKVVGLTTASEIWALAAIGLAIGIGLYVIAIVSTSLILLVLIIGKRLEGKIGQEVQETKKKRK